MEHAKIYIVQCFLDHFIPFFVHSPRFPKLEYSLRIFIKNKNVSLNVYKLLF